MRKFITNLFIVTTVILAVVYIFELRQSASLQEKLTRKENEAKATSEELSVSKTEAVKLKKEVVEIKEEVAALKTSKEELTAQVKQHTEKLDEVAATAADKEKKDGTAGEKFSEGLAEMMESPEMRDTMRLQLETTLINPVFGNLFKELGLSVEDSEVFRNLLSDRLMVGVSSGMKMMSSNKEEREALKDQIKQGEEEIDSMINDLLGKEGFEKYEGYKDTRGERMALNQFNQQLGLSGIGLTPEQNDKLVSAMYDERLEAQKNPGYFDAEKADPGDFNDEAVQKSLSQQERINKGTLERAKIILKADQYEKFDLFLINLQRQREMQLKMAQQMFGGGKKK